MIADKYLAMSDEEFQDMLAALPTESLKLVKICARVLYPKLEKLEHQLTEPVCVKEVPNDLLQKKVDNLEAKVKQLEESAKEQSCSLSARQIGYVEGLDKAIGEVQRINNLGSRTDSKSLLINMLLRCLHDAQNEVMLKSRAA